MLISLFYLILKQNYAVELKNAMQGSILLSLLYCLPTKCMLMANSIGQHQKNDDKIFVPKFSIFLQSIISKNFHCIKMLSHFFVSRLPIPKEFNESQFVCILFFLVFVFNCLNIFGCLCRCIFLPIKKDYFSCCFLVCVNRLYRNMVRS